MAFAEAAETSPMTAPDPVPPADAPPPRMMGAVFWIAIVFTLMCIAGGYMIAKLGPDLFPGKPAAGAPPAASPALAAEVVALTRRVERLEAERGRCAEAGASQPRQARAPRRDAR